MFFFQGEGIEEAATESEAAAVGGHHAPHGHHPGGLPGGPHGGLPGGLPGHPAGLAGQGHPGHHGHSHEEEDSGCECGLEELEGDLLFLLQTVELEQHCNLFLLTDTFESLKHRDQTLLYSQLKQMPKHEKRHVLYNIFGLFKQTMSNYNFSKNLLSWGSGGQNPHKKK